MKTIGVIPARWASVRFPGKVLAPIAGKPMIQHVWERAQKSRRLDEVIIATDDEKVLLAARGFGAEAVMTSPKHQSGTDRIAESVAKRRVDVVLNIQGDEPLVSPKAIDALIAVFSKDRSIRMSTAIRKIDNEADVNNPNVVKVVIDRNKDALYFSRHAIPFNRENRPFQPGQYYKHFGLYAYRKNFLMSFKKLSRSVLEEAEKLEQLRVLESGFRIRTVEVDYDSIGVDVPADRDRAEMMMRSA